MKTIVFRLLITFSLSFQAYCLTKKFLKQDMNTTTLLNEKYGGNLPQAILDIISGFPLNDLVIAFDSNTETDMLYAIINILYSKNICVTLFNITTVDFQTAYFAYLSKMFQKYHGLTTLFLCNTKLSEHVVLEVQYNNLIRRNFILIFYWPEKRINRFFIRSMNEFMKIIVLTNPRPGTYRIYYNQALSHKKHHLEMVNWWNSVEGLFRRPTLPSPKTIFNNFNGKVFNIPVIHKPPWHFVRYVNDCIEVLGGRDDKLLKLLSKSLNFKFEYFDPPDRNQGSSVLENGSFEGVLGLIGKRKADFFIGDVTLTVERLSVVEFSFLTLADSVAFVTHAPSRLNEALALVRPFHWQVWPAVVATLIVSGPILYILIALPNKWRPRRHIPSHCNLFFECCWFTTTLFLKQTGREPSASNKSRFFIIILSLSATYIISDMYSANLTSLLAKPGREKSINNLIELEEAMINRKFKLYVEKLSSSYSLLENGTGIYGRLWKMMINNQRTHVINSVEEGVKLVSRAIDIAFIAGRETLYFDIQRFGAKNFHLSEKLNTAYSAIAFQIGCPYIENFNKILMAIFEAGILTKMTESEYENLGKRQKSDVSAGIESDSQKKPNNENDPLDEKDEKLQPINIKMLQGAFYLLFMGSGFSAFVLMLEILYERQQYNIRKVIRLVRKRYKKLKRRCCYYYRKLRNVIRERFRQMLHEAFVETLEYIE